MQNGVPVLGNNMEILKSLKSYMTILLREMKI
jgi:hypothetical protein